MGTLDDEVSYFTAVYASTIPSVRTYWWEALHRIASACSSPWLIAGDFNALLFPSEKKGGSDFRSGVSKPFLHWFNSCHMLDLRCKGLKYTWVRGSLMERLDRAICNQSWLNPVLSIVHAWLFGQHFVVDS